MVEYSQVKAGWFIQDDFRPSRNLQLSLGLRQEVQTQVDSKWNFAPRAAVHVERDQDHHVRGGYGIFYDWYDAGVYEQTIRVDGNHQVDVIVQNPGFPVIEGGWHPPAGQRDSRRHRSASRSFTRRRSASKSR